jgi:hypothetical protein
MSPNALTCPHCGAPNKKAMRKKQSSTQAVGCLSVILGIILFFLMPLLGVPLVIAGIVVLIISLFL